MKTVYCTSFSSTIGTLHVASTEQGVCKVCIPAQTRRDFFSWIDRHLPDYRIEESEKENNRVIDELHRYFRQRLVMFHTPVHLIGSEFQIRVWRELKKIRYGSTLTYRELARRVAMPGAFQAVGRANAENPLPIIIPCHRVLGKNDRMTGYAGGIKTKEFLLRLEGALLI